MDSLPAEPPGKPKEHDSYLFLLQFKIIGFSSVSIFEVREWRREDSDFSLVSREHENLEGFLPSAMVPYLLL